ncbi:MAG TPA: TIR domain-containing protein [Caulobacteraceae bacterium]|nr:TIR domain-containing protein [Caulobacteraceae bacterium]
MPDVFISYARSTAVQVRRIADALRALEWRVWIDEELPAHRDYSDVIEERLRQAKAVVVVWSAEAVKSQWVRAEADVAREAGTLVQLSVDGAIPPLPFNRIQCADLAGWSGELDSPGWRKVLASIAELVGEDSVAEVGRPAPAPTLPEKPSIAVLPFTDMTGADDRTYFTDGMVVEIITALSRFPSLFVIASGSSLAYRSGERDLRLIARDLGVRYLLQGSVRQSAGRVRIAAQLVDAHEGGQLWAERFDGTLEDVFALQDTVANAVVGQLAPAVEAAEIRRANAKPTQDLRAYDLYLRALHLMHAWNKQAFLDAISLLDQAVARDPGYAMAYALAGNIHTLLAMRGWSDQPEQSRRVGLELGQQALRAGGDDHEVLLWVAGTIVQARGDTATADSMIERSLALNPGASFSWFISGWAKLYLGRFELSFAHFETSLRLNPRSPQRANTLNGMGLCQLAMRRFDEAIVLQKQAVQLHPGDQGTAMGLVASLAHAGRIPEARATLQNVHRSTIDNTLGGLRDPGFRELLRSGLALAGADL